MTHLPIHTRHRGLSAPPIHDSSAIFTLNQALMSSMRFIIVEGGKEGRLDGWVRDLRWWGPGPWLAERKLEAAGMVAFRGGSGGNSSDVVEDGCAVVILANRNCTCSGI